ncbi:sigma-70 family RNA polymerase sigma factor [Nonomuraea sp. 3-1Str]|uniref:sigma-70 family RNA polymerase sigma factor n=2 Tax=Nonomuraea TaxID=83681 RepID=UPI0028650C40|nr:sigma-70 family RNA polymerase sigma factor [Nonomuraea sp. 3-1Str]
MRTSTYPPPSAEGAGLMGKPRLSQWIRRVRPDDDLVVSALYREYHGPLLAFVVRLTAGDRQWAEDVVQETMIRAWRSAERLDPASVSLMPWLATVARRIVIDDRRRRDARPQESGDGPLESVPVPDEMEGLLHQVLVSDALRALSPAHREILNETILRDRSVNDAAEALGIPVGTVKSRVYYAVRALRVALEERGVTA